MKPQSLSIIVPVRNEKQVLLTLVDRIHCALSAGNISYEIIFVDDRSTDGSLEVMGRLAKLYPIKIHQKQGKLGKAYSILEGATLATNEWIVMLDADLQYAPEAIPAMALIAGSHGVVVANRKTYKGSFLRRTLSRTNAFVFGKLLFGLSADIQSGLKLFRKDILDHIDPSTVKPWAFDIPLLSTAKELGYTIGSVDITFELRTGGASKINLMTTAWQIASGAVATWLNIKPMYTLPPKNDSSMIGAGVAHGRKRFITHSTLPHHVSALVTFTDWQQLAIIVDLASVAIGFILYPLATAIVLVGILSTIYFLDVLFNLFLVLKSLHKPPDLSVSEGELEALDNSRLPYYSILCPLYREAHVLPQFLEAIGALDWPKNKLDVLLLLEEDDTETIVEVKKLDIPNYVRVLVVPDSQPKTKPKACNWGLAHAKGEYVVIYDAEDIPDPKQLKVAYAAFRKVSANTVCLQAKLNFYNPHHNLLTRLFTAEYSLWFDVVLTGLQSIETSIPLGGTSNHFKTGALRALHGWDAFNVTEDCDLGTRLFKEGYKTAVIDSTTLEEANSRPFNWLRQRSRWIKGYLQTYLVHMRNPIDFTANHGIHAFIFQLVVGGKIAFMFINPFLWIATISYFALYALVGPAIEALYPSVIFYMAVTSLIFGNFLFIFYYMIGCARRGHWSLVKYVYLVPFYWLMVSVSASIALVQLIVKPHFWEKTHHGFHIKKANARATIVAANAAKDEARSAKIRRLTDFISSGVASGGILVAASMVSNVFNFFYNAYLSRHLAIEDFGLIGLFGNLMFLAQVLFIGVSRTVTQKSAYLFGKHKEIIKDYWRWVRAGAVKVSLILGGLWLLAIPVLTPYFNAQSIIPFVLFTPVWIVGLADAVDGGFMSGTFQFVATAIFIVFEASIKLGLTWTLVQLGLTQWVYAVVPLAMTISFFIGYWYLRRLKTRSVALNTQEIHSFSKRFFTTSVLTRISVAAFLSFDVILAKHYLTATQAGAYALLSLVGKIIFFMSSLSSQFIIPFVSREEGAGRNPKSVFHKLMLVTTTIAALTYLAVGVMGSVTAPILFGAKTSTIVSFLPIYGLAMLYFSIATGIISYHQSLKQYLFSVVGFLLAAAQVGGIVLFHEDIAQFVSIMFIMGNLSILLTILFHIFYEQFATIGRNISDFLDLFRRLPSNPAQQTEKLRILVFNWRDTKHVWAGGAEAYIQKLAKRWVLSGHSVTVFCGNDSKHPRNQVISGVRIVRRGGFYTVYFWAMLYYLFRFRGQFDVVIDSENGVPFFTPLYVQEPIVLLIHHIHRKVFDEHLRFGLSHLANFAESTLMPLVYKEAAVVTVSESSRQEILKLGMTHPSLVNVISPGIDSDDFRKSKKTTYPSFLYLGRLKPYKNIGVGLRAFAYIRKTHQTAKLTIAGFGESMVQLQNLAHYLKLGRSVTFLGKVTEEEKVRLYGQHWVALQPSTTEGWGMTVIEANACGTPVIAANVSGLRDSVVHRKTGLLVKSKDVGELVDAMEQLISATSYRKELSREAYRWSKAFHWEDSAIRFTSLLLKVTQKAVARSPYLKVYLYEGRRV